MNRRGSYEALLHEILVVPRKVHVPLPDTQVIERPGWFQLLTPSLCQGGLNEVSLAVLQVGEVDAVVDATLVEYRRRGLRMRWCVGPDSRPDDLAERLAQRGLTRTETRGMYHEMGDWVGDDPKLPVERVDEGTVAEFTRTMADGWEVDPGPLHAFHCIILAHPERRPVLYLARHAGQAIGTAAAYFSARSAYLMGAVVLPAFRGRGVYRALVAARLRDAAARGLSLVTGQAKAQTSAPILERLGFRALISFPMFTNG